MTPLIDTHCHLLPGVDDGCATLDESVACARRFAEAGYTHVACTPHVWPNLPHNNVREIAVRVGRLQAALDAAGIALRLVPGGENNFRELDVRQPKAEIPTYGMAGRYALADVWVEAVPAWFWEKVRWLRSLDLVVILAHPERMRAVQRDPGLADQFADAGLRLQGNLQCFADPVGTATRDVAERYLAEGRYFMLGSDLHGTGTVANRLRGLERVRNAVDGPTFRRLTHDAPREVLGL
jgi:protein-tyrosine phosphatase